ncbi:hypothetical protein [Nesterenkonia halophila]
MGTAPVVQKDRVTLEKQTLQARTTTRIELAEGIQKETILRKHNLIL